MNKIKYYKFIGEVLQKGRVRSTRNRRACMTRCMNVDEAKGVCKDRSRRRSAPWEKGVSLCMYYKLNACIICHR